MLRSTSLGSFNLMQRGFTERANLTLDESEDIKQQFIADAPCRTGLGRRRLRR